jgi:predicted transglutaminase-like cysteine proteinase
MKYPIIVACAAFLTVLFTPVANAEPTSAALAREPQRFMRVYGTALPPYGFVQFCEMRPRECAPHTMDDRRFDANPARMHELDQINRQVNRAIKPATDMELYGVAEFWTLPTDKGDCEDYALLKRQTLIRRGWPANALLMTVVRDEKGEGHAVLTARTLQGDFILDNKVEELKLWHRTPYQFLMRQSYLNPRVWMSLDPRDSASPGLLAGIQGFR